MPYLVVELSIPLTLIVLLWFSSVAGARFAKRVKVRSDDMPSIGVVQGALLGLLALLLGFSFSGAMMRFAARQDLLVHEANAVGTSWLRADVLPAEHREPMRTALRRYADARVDLFEARTDTARDAASARVVSAFEQVWAVGVEAARAQPQLAVAILPPLNEISDLLSSQRAAHGRHIPNMVMAVLLACACGSVAAVGFGLVFVDRRTHLPAIVLVLLITGSLWLIVDMDYPKLGLIRVDGQPLLDMRAELNK